MTAHTLTRRSVLTAGAAAAALTSLPAPLRAASTNVPAPFPSTAPELAKEIVGASHGNIGRVRELLAEDRSLALASWDWGFGDWESALGAASHMGNHEMARLLIDHGARPNLFTWAMMDQVDAVRAVCEAQPGVQSIAGPHGITLLSHAKFGKAARVESYLRELGGADEGPTILELSEEQAATYLGEYTFEGDGGIPLLVERHRRGGIGLLRRGGSFRRLHRVGDDVFQPSGAPHVTVRFMVKDGRAVGLTVHRGGPLVSATRTLG